MGLDRWCVKWRLHHTSIRPHPCSSRRQKAVCGIAGCRYHSTCSTRRRRLISRSIATWRTRPVSERRCCHRSSCPDSQNAQPHGCTIASHTRGTRSDSTVAHRSSVHRRPVAIDDSTAVCPPRRSSGKCEVMAAMIDDCFGVTGGWA